jgi:Tfp pilus assembly protein PilX
MTARNALSPRTVRNLGAAVPRPPRAPRPRRRQSARRVARYCRTRRGVASVLAMMFVVLFGSLAVAMAIVSKGNLRTAQTHLHVLRAMGAADTGLAVAQKRLADATARFIVEKGQVDGDFGSDLWNGTYTAGDGQVRVLANTGGFTESVTPTSIAQAVVNAFEAEQNKVTINGIPADPLIHTAPAGTDTSEYKSAGWVSTPAIAIDGDASQTGLNVAAYQVEFAPLANGTDVRIIVTGYSSVSAAGGSSYHYGGFSTQNHLRPLTRVIQQDFRVVKRHEHAMLSPSRIMIGKNVHVSGDLGSRYTDVAQNNGHPMVIKSDFMGLSPVLDAKLTAFYTNVLQYDVDGDNRLRVGHSVEGAGLPSNATDYDGDGHPDNAFADATGDGYVDDFDIFMNHYDTNHDGKVVLAASLTVGTPAEGQTPEFTVDDDLALLIDSGHPDRNGNGVWGYTDTNHNGKWDAGETLLDVDTLHTASGGGPVYPDRALGYRDGVIDRKDAYHKVNGRLVFSASESAWNTAHGDPQQYLRGSLAPGAGQAPQRFSATTDELPDITAASFTSAQTPLRAAADGAAFDSQVAQQLGVAVSSLPTYTEASSDSTHVRYFRSDLSDATVYAMTGRHLYEKMPFNSPSFSDWYYRPRYENLTFNNVQIPEGNNALFVNCVFVGVTYVRTYTDNTHENWTLYGKMEWDATQNHPVTITDPLDRSDFARYTTGNPIDGPENYNDFPNPPTIHGSVRTGDTRNTKLYSNNIRFHDCLFVGTIVSDTPTEYTHVRNKLQFTGATRFTTENPDHPNDPNLNPDPADMDQIRRSSMMLPQYSVDIGQFNSPTDTYSGGPAAQNVNLSGTIVAGVLDIRGNANIDGSLLLTFAPIAGQGPLQQHGQAIGNPAGFNATIGYFGPADGDGESLDPATLPIVGGHRIVGYDTDGDGLPDVGPDQAQPPGSTAVPFYGYGRINLSWNPDLPMPDGIMLPVTITPLTMTYREGRR